jgi:carbon-monoxide dehydrogenase large subunit
MNDVTVIHGDTAIVQYGIGTFGSRATAVGGTAVLIAIQKLKEKAAKIAAHMMQCDAAGVSFEAGNIFAASCIGGGRRDFRTGCARGRSAGWCSA